MKIWLTAIFLTITINSWCQQQLTFPVIHDYDNFKWASIEKKMPRAEVDRFINVFPKEFEAYRRSNESEFRNLDSLVKHLHFVDINVDGNLDVIFDGQGSGEGSLVQLFINTGKGFKEIFSDMQGVAKIDWEENKMKRLYIVDWSSADDYIETNKIYGFTYDQPAAPAYKQIYQSIAINGFSAVRPDSLFDKPTRFEVLNNNYKIRSAPVIDDTGQFHWNKNQESEKGQGNSIGKLPKGTTGTALGKKTDATGREWWYVEIDETYQFDRDMLYVQNKFPTRVIGWISSRFIKVL